MVASCDAEQLLLLWGGQADLGVWETDRAERLLLRNNDLRRLLAHARHCDLPASPLVVKRAIERRIRQGPGD